MNLVWVHFFVLFLFKSLYQDLLIEDAGRWTQGLMPAKQILYHWALYPPQISAKQEWCSWNIGWILTRRAQGSLEFDPHKANEILSASCALQLFTMIPYLSLHTDSQRLNVMMWGRMIIVPFPVHSLEERLLHAHKVFGGDAKDNSFQSPKSTSSTLGETR